MPPIPLPLARPSVEIDLDALCANYRALSAAAPGAETAAVVKCNAYGLGIEPVARALAARENCRAFFVAYAEEGAALRAILKDIAPQARIYVFNGPSTDTVDLFAASRLTPALNSLDQARLWDESCAGAPAAVHIDTGMNRLGAPAGELDAIAALGLDIELVLSHLACASDLSDPMNDRQRILFEEKAAKFPGAKRSLSASGGVLMGRAFHHELVRPGVSLYGVGPFDSPDPRIKPVARLTAPVIQLRSVKAGDAAGYGGTRRFARDSRLATVALGYGDGFPRAGSNRASAFIGGASCPIAGRVSMDLIILDVTDAPEEVRIGDRAEFFGPTLPIEEAAAACGTIGYELLTGLGPRLYRRYLSGTDAPPESGG